MKDLKIADWSTKEIADANYEINLDYFKKGTHRQYESFFKLKEAFEFVLGLIETRPLLVLEIGCGAGWQIKYLLEEGIAQHFFYEAMDISQHMIDYATKNFPNGTYSVGDIVSQQPEKNFNVVYEAATVQLLSDWRRALQNMMKCATDFVILHRVFYTTKPSFIEQVVTYHNIPDCRHWINLDELSDIFNQGNFELIKSDLWRPDLGTFIARRKK